MDIIKAIDERHSVRQYLIKPINEDALNKLTTFIKQINEQSGLNIQLITNEPKSFSALLSHYGKFDGVQNYVALVGKREHNLNEKLGYYGEKIVLLAQQLGLNTCWVALSYKKNKNAVKVNKGEKFVAVISIGYGKTQGAKRKSKSITQISDADNNSPDWYINGLKCALKAPTALNQQKFYFTRKNNQISVKRKLGFYTLLDVGIVKLHFEIGAGKDNFVWKS